MYEYVKGMKDEGGRVKVNGAARVAASRIAGKSSIVHPSTSIPSVDRTPKLFIAGKQARPASVYSRAVLNPQGEVVAQLPLDQPGLLVFDMP